MASRKEAVKIEVTSNMEDYLEAILELTEDSGEPEARVTAIARRINVTRPSVVGMIRRLSALGLAYHHRYGGVGLTESGRKIAWDTAERHQVLRHFLEEVLGLDAEIAEVDACRMEHTLSPETIDRFVALEEFRRDGPEEGRLGSESFRRFLVSRKRAKKREG